MAFLSTLKSSLNKGAESVAQSAVTIDRSEIIETVVKVNYDTVLTGIGMAGRFFGEVRAVEPPVRLLQQAARNYHESTAETAVKEQEYIDFVINNINVELTLQMLNPIANSIPMGNVIINLLEFLVKQKTSKKQVEWHGYTVIVDEQGSVGVLRGGMPCDKIKAVLREISDEAGFAYDEEWNTRQFGNKLIDFLGQLDCTKK